MKAKLFERVDAYFEAQYDLFNDSELMQRCLYLDKNTGDYAIADIDRIESNSGGIMVFGTDNNGNDTHVLILDKHLEMDLEEFVRIFSNPIDEVEITEETIAEARQAIHAEVLFLTSLRRILLNFPLLRTEECEQYIEWLCATCAVEFKGDKIIYFTSAPRTTNSNIPYTRIVERVYNVVKKLFPHTTMLVID